MLMLCVQKLAATSFRDVMQADQTFEEGNVTKLGQFSDNLVARFVGGANR